MRFQSNVRLRPVRNRWLVTLAPGSPTQRVPSPAALPFDWVHRLSRRATSHSVGRIPKGGTWEEGAKVDGTLAPNTSGTLSLPACISPVIYRQTGNVRGHCAI